jgi:hypothetical protein
MNRESLKVATSKKIKAELSNHINADAESSYFLAEKPQVHGFSAVAFGVVFFEHSTDSGRC